MLWEWENGGARVYILDLDGTLMPTPAYVPNPIANQEQKS